MSDNFFFRIRGEVKGPFSREQIISLIRKKRLGRHHELSADGVHWQRAGDVEGLFESLVTEERTPAQEIVEEVRSPTAEPAASADAHSVASQPLAGGPDDWFYAKGRNTHGPISARDLRAMLATGRVLGTDRIWNESLSDWVPAADVPQFMGSIQDSGNPYPNPLPEQRQVARPSSFFDIFLGMSSDMALPDKASTKFPNLCRYLAIAELVFRILFILQIVAAAGWYAFLLIEMARVGGTVEIAIAFFVGMAALLLGIASIWFVFLAAMAMLELVKVLIRIEDNTATHR
ncbi:MAG: DUF4339 domain-containing protein [Planctomyces sp.]|nr:DUF4339 domain-containing protein [Planctomyces sp.]